MLYRQIRNYTVRATTHHDLDSIEKHMNEEDYTSDDFKKYFNVWRVNGRSIYYFPKERYFESRNDVHNYAIALLQYVGVLQSYDEV